MSAFNSSRPYVLVWYTTTKHSNANNACSDFSSLATGFVQHPTTNLYNFDSITQGSMLYSSSTNGTQPIADGYYGQYWRKIQNDLSGTKQKSVTLTTGYDPSSYGQMMGLYTCPGSPTPTPTPTPTVGPTPTPTPTPSPTPIPPPPFVDNLEYAWFTLRNLSYSKKIFGYYSGSANFDFNFNTSTSSADPGSGYLRLNSGSIGSGGTTNENQAKEIYIDVKDSNGEEDIVSYLTSLAEIPNAGNGSIQIEVSGSEFYYLTYDINTIETGSSIASNGYFKLDVTNTNSESSNPISSSISSSGDFTPPIIVKFFNNIIPGYYETEVLGNQDVSLTACITQTPSYGSGSISQPFAIDWGVPESTFIDPDYYPSNYGYAWLWNDGYKVKHIKMNNKSSTGDILTDFIKGSEWVRYIMYNPINADRNLLHTGDGFYAEDYQLFNVTKYSTQGYSHLFVDQDSVDTSFAIDVSTQENIVDTFTATGKYIVYASSSGTVIEPTRSISVDSSIPQGYFPSSSTNYPTEQFFRGWADANYYVNGTLIPTTGELDDPLQSFNQGSTERDKDGAANYIPSTLPFFIDATASYIEVPASNFVEYNGQSNLTKIGPGFVTAGGGEIIYYYKEDTNQIVIRGSEYLNTPKTSTLDFDPRYDVQLVGPNSSTDTFYATREGFVIQVKPSQSLWLTRGLSNIGVQDGDIWKYNRHLHRPFKTYILTSTGSTELGYGSSTFGADGYGSGSLPVGPPPNEFESVYIAYSSSKASDRPNDGLYTFDSVPLEELYITASVDLGYTSIDIVRSSSYGTASYGEDEFEYGGTGSGDTVNTWQNAYLKLYQNNTVIASEITSINSSNILYGLTSTLETSLQPYQISIGDTLKLSLEVANEASGFNSSLVVNAYTMSFNNLVYASNNLTPVTFNNYLELNDDCNPLINTITVDRPNERLQDVDYSVDILNPINFEQIIRDKAVRATVPESNYTQTGYSEARYDGTKSNSSLINKWTQGDTGTYGKVPNIELKNAYFAYFSKIYDLYPILEGTTALEIKYLFDGQGNRFNPRLGDFNYYNLSDTFEPGSILNLSTNVKESEELILLNKEHNIKLVGKKPIPILYTQIGGREYTGSISFTGFQPPQPDPPTFNDYSFKATGSIFPSQARTFNEQQLSPDNGISGSAVNVTQSYFPNSGDIIIPTTDHLAPNGAGSGKVTSDTYSLNIEHIFETTPIKRILTVFKTRIF